MEAGLFQIVGRTLRCDLPCELCAAIEEQVNQPLMRAELEPSKKTKKKRGQPPTREEPEKKMKLSIPLAHPLCDNTTKISKFMNHTHEKAALEGQDQPVCGASHRYAFA
jgi:hypothetical protein